MAGQWWSDDGELLAALGEALRSARDVPRRFVEAGQAAFAWHNIDAELAALTYDSAAERPERLGATRAEQLGATRAEQLGATRAESATLRALTFASNRLSIHLEVTRVALHGQVVPAQLGKIELHPLDGAPITIDIDEVGWFVIRPIPAGRFRLWCRVADGTTVLTDSITM